MIKLFFPLKHRENLPIEFIKRVPILINTNFILILYFVFASFTRYRADPEATRIFFIAVLASCSSFVISLMLIRFKHYIIASTFSMLGIFLNSLWIGILLPLTNYMDLYRFSVYIIAASTVNILLSFRRLQIWLYSITTFAAFVCVSLFYYAPRFGGFTGEIRTIFTTLSMLYIAVTIVFFIINKISTDLLTVANVEMQKNKAKADALNELIRNTKNTMKVGADLVEYAGQSTASANQIKNELLSIADSARKLSTDATCADETNRGIVEFAQKMQEAVDNQNSFLQETSSAVTEIMTTIQNIAQLAEQKKSIMNAVVNKIEAQGNEIKKLTEGFEAIQESSRSVLSVISSILDISEKTNMLAMNASIEAAHAGAAGKGFAVISGEIRKLSSETQVSTQLISQALSRNQEVIDTASNLIHRYTASLKDVIEDVRDTFNSFEEIIAGL
ncbi:MAG TPA: methyl-accepting chemotaxis protein, partial [Spirochaetales bacterium]|nr:methyl-accepting chemotaxis protein [Spirochaetales bacterium]